MPRSKKGTPPAYQSHSSGQARVTVRTVSGRRLDLLLGPYDSMESRYEYQRVLNVLKTNNGRYPDPQPVIHADLTVDELILAWWEQRGVPKWGTTGKELVQHKYALRPLRELYGTHPASHFTPKCLKSVRQRMVDMKEYLVKPTGQEGDKGRWLSEAKVKATEGLAQLHGKAWRRVEVLESRQALSRKVINRHLVRIRSLFSWAVGEELVPGTIAAALRHVKGFPAGEKGVKESKPRPPAFWDDVTTVLPHCPRPVAAMLQLQWLTGMRSGEVRVMRTLDLDRSNPDCWLYRPGSDAGPHGRHKNAWRGQDRVVPLGPQCIEVLKPWLLEGEPGAYLFSPRRWMAQHYSQRIQERKSKRQPSQSLAVRKKSKPKRRPGECYSATSYPHAVARACAKAGISFNPYSLRHGRKMDVERQHGSDGARCVLGQKSISATQHYGEIDVARAADILKDIG